LEYTQEGWQAIRPLPAVSMINAVFLRVREDKTVSPTAIRLSQVTDLVPVGEAGPAQPVEMPGSTVLRREVLTKNSGSKLCIRKVVVWKTNKEQIGPLYPPYVVFFTDFSPGRDPPLKTDIRVSSSLEAINQTADTWLKHNQTRGWKPHNEEKTGLLPLSFSDNKKDNKLQLELGISFTRSSSLNFPLTVSRIKSLSKSGALAIEYDKKGRPLQYSLALKQDKLIENVRKIRNLLKIILLWKGTEFMVNGDPLGINELYDLLGKLDTIVACWMMQKRNQQPCRNSFALGCGKLSFEPSSGFPGLPQEHPAWYAVGTFEDSTVTIDKQNLIAQLSSYRNELPVLCPLYEEEKIRQRIEALPERLDPEKDSKHCVMGHSMETGKPAWVFPREHRYFPFGITTQTNHSVAQGGTPNNAASGISPKPNIGIGLRIQFSGSETQTAPYRNIPQTRYADVCGQDSAVEQVRDYAELPLKHAALFKQVGIKPGRGILLWGPPGNGKTLLARAVAGESGSHIETISGPELLSKWVGETERMLRETFQQAARFAPSVIIMDEVDAIAGAPGYGRPGVSQAGSLTAPGADGRDLRPRPDIGYRNHQLPRPYRPGYLATGTYRP